MKSLPPLGLRICGNYLSRFCGHSSETFLTRFGMAQGRGFPRILDCRNLEKCRENPQVTSPVHNLPKSESSA